MGQGAEAAGVGVEEGRKVAARRVGGGVALVPVAVVLHQPDEALLAEAGPRQVDGRGVQPGRRGGQLALRGRVFRARGAEPVARDEAEVAAAATGVGPPQLAVRVAGLAGGHDRAGAAGGARDDHLDGVQVVDDQAEVAGEQAVAAAADVAAGADGVADAARQGHAPPLVQGLVDGHQVGAGLDVEGTAALVVADGGHLGEVEEDLDLGVAREIGEAVAAGADGDPLAPLDRLTQRVLGVTGRADHLDVLGARHVAPVDPRQERGIAGVGGQDLRAERPGAAGRAGRTGRTAYGSGGGGVGGGERAGDPRARGDGGGGEESAAVQMRHDRFPCVARMRYVVGGLCGGGGGGAGPRSGAGGSLRLRDPASVGAAAVRRWRRRRRSGWCP